MYPRGTCFFLSPSLRRSLFRTENIKIHEVKLLYSPLSGFAGGMGKGRTGWALLAFRVEKDNRGEDEEKGRRGRVKRRRMKWWRRVV